MKDTIAEKKYTLAALTPSPSAAASQNACKPCAPLGAALVFKGIRGAVPLLHGSQGCSTYIRRYLISHFREPVDIACSNFSEQTAIFGGGANLQMAMDNVRSQYAPALIGVATTCLSETIGDDVPMFIRAYRAKHVECGDLPLMVHVSTPSYQGSHMEGFHRAVRATVETLAVSPPAGLAERQVNLFAGMLSPTLMNALKNCEHADVSSDTVARTSARPYVAVATREGVLVNQHLGAADRLLIYGWTEARIALIESRPTPAAGSGPARWHQLADLLDDCHTLLVSGVGTAPRKILGADGMAVIACEGLIEGALRRLQAGQRLDDLAVRKPRACKTACAGDMMGCG